jgi:hypothetical protein
VTENSDERPRPTPRPRPAGQRPSPAPRPRVAGSRREREADAAERAIPGPPPAARPRPARRGGGTAGATSAASGRRGGTATTGAATARARRRPVAALTLAVLCLLAAAGGGVLLWQRTHPPYVDASVFDATRSGVEALYAFDYKHADASVAGKLAVLTGDLRDQYKKDLSQGGIVDTYKQVSATTSYDVVDVGLQQINDAQDSATLVVFGQYVVKSVNSGSQAAPQGSECTTTSAGAQSCTQTVQVHETKVGGHWKISDLTVLTTS